jgi:viroplasmin and RNaseH domain-containing protein
MKGIYKNWAIARLHIDGKPVRHKAYPTMEEAKTAFNAAYKEIATSVNMGQPSTMEVKKKVSVDSIINLQKMQKREVKLDDFLAKWRW